MPTRSIHSYVCLNQLDVIAALHKENEKKDLQIKELRDQMLEQAEALREEKEDVIEEYEKRISG